MTSEFRMTPEQWQALEDWIRARVLSALDPCHETFSASADACNKARRLLVEPEQPKLHDGPCIGGPLGGSSMAMDVEVVKRPGGEYEWGSDLKEWYWIPDDPADLTTFGELDGRGWFELSGEHRLTGEHRDEGDRIRLLTADGVVYDEEGLRRMVENDEPVRRLPKPEWSK